MNHDLDQLEITFNRDKLEVRSGGSWNRIVNRRTALGIGGMTLGGLYLAACGGGSDDTTNAGATGATGSTGGGLPGEGKTIGISINGFNEYTQSDTTGSLKALEGTGYKTIIRQADYDAQKEITNIQNLLSQGLDAIVIFPVTEQSANQGATLAKQRGVPAFNKFWTSDSIGEENYIGVISVDNLLGGQMVADFIKEQVPGGGEVLVVQGTPGQGFVEEFNSGLADSLGSDWPIVGTQSGEYVRSTAIDVVQTMMTANPNAKVIVDHAAEMGVGIASYLKSTNRDDMVTITSDANQEMVDWLQTPYLTASRYFSPAENGFTVIELVRNYLENGEEPAEKVVQLPQQIVTADDLVEDPPPGVINPDLEPASGIFAYAEFMKEVERI